MYAAAHAAERTIGVGFALRWMVAMREARRVVEAGTLGRVVSARARALGRDIPWWGIHWQKRVSGGGFVASTAVHVLDAALWVAGFPSEPTRVSASFARLYPEKRPDSAPSPAAAEAYDTEDTAAAHVRFADRSWLMLDGGWLCDVPNEESTVEVVGVAGTMSVDPLWLVLERDGVPVDATPHLPDDDYSAALAAGVKDAAERVRDGSPPFVPEREVLAVQAIVDAIYRSAEAGHEVGVESP